MLILTVCITRIIQEHRGYLYSDRKKERPAARYVCLFPQHLQNLDLDVNLALIGRLLTRCPLLAMRLILLPLLCYSRRSDPRHEAGLMGRSQVYCLLCGLFCCHLWSHAAFLRPEPSGAIEHIPELIGRGYSSYSSNGFALGNSSAGCVVPAAELVSVFHIETTGSGPRSCHR